MGKRPFNKAAYDRVDKPANIKLAEILLNKSDYKPLIDLDVELYKKGDAVFTNGKKIIVFENETRDAFDRIVEEFETIHIPIRKQQTPADFYVVWKPDFSQFILIDKKTLDKNRNNIIVDVVCKHERNQSGEYVEDFMDIPKEETQWYIIGPNYKLQKVSYD
ncbi:MAG: hypothetical protein R3182_06955 [Draconibacterium sp.]|nr:hypothetical protein [Draconibacterium sp.]